MFLQKNVYFDKLCADVVYSSEKSNPYLLNFAAKQF